MGPRLLIVHFHLDTVLASGEVIS